MTTKHTPGPWKVDCRFYPNSFHISAGDKIPICEVDHWGKRQSDLTADLKPEGQAEANARLIAAAPELLEACQASLDRFGGVRPDDFAKASQIEYDQLQSAIAKVEKP